MSILASLFARASHDADQRSASSDRTTFGWLLATESERQCCVPCACPNLRCFLATGVSRNSSQVRHSPTAKLSRIFRPVPFSWDATWPAADDNNFSPRQKLPKSSGSSSTPSRICDGRAPALRSASTADASSTIAPISKNGPNRRADDRPRDRSCEVSSRCRHGDCDSAAPRARHKCAGAAACVERVAQRPDRTLRRDSRLAARWRTCPRSPACRRGDAGSAQKIPSPLRLPAQACRRGCRRPSLPALGPHIRQRPFLGPGANDGPRRALIARLARLSHACGWRAVPPREWPGRLRQPVLWSPRSTTHRGPQLPHLVKSIVPAHARTLAISLHKIKTCRRWRQKKLSPLRLFDAAVRDQRSKGIRAVPPSRCSRAVGLYGAKCATEPPFRRLGPAGNDPYRAARCSVTMATSTPSSAARPPTRLSMNSSTDQCSVAGAPSHQHPRTRRPTPHCSALMSDRRPIAPPML